MGFLDAGLHAVSHGHLPVDRIDVVQHLQQRSLLTAFRWFAMAHRRYIDSGAQPDGWMR
jgi:hypothetical protein